MQVRRIHKVRTHWGGRCELEEKRLRVVWHIQVIVQRLQITVEAACKGPHGYIDAVCWRLRSTGNGNGCGIERERTSLKVLVNVVLDGNDKPESAPTDSNTVTAYRL